MTTHRDKAGIGERPKRYFIEVRGFEGHYVVARSAGAARYKDFRAWREAGFGQRLTFRDFLDRIVTFHHHGPTQDGGD